MKFENIEKLTNFSDIPEHVEIGWKMNIHASWKKTSAGKALIWTGTNKEKIHVISHPQKNTSHYSQLEIDENTRQDPPLFEDWNKRGMGKVISCGILEGRRPLACALLVTKKPTAFGIISSNQAYIAQLVALCASPMRVWQIVASATGSTEKNALEAFEMIAGDLVPCVASFSPS